MAQPFDAGRLVLTGEAFPVAGQIQTQLLGGISSGVFSASDNGVLVYQTGTASPTAPLTWFDRTGKALATVGDPGVYGDLALAPDATQAVVTIVDSAQGTRDLWLIDLMRGVPSRLTFDPADEVTPVWTPDSARLLFGKRVKGTDVYQKASSGSGADEALLSDGFANLPQSVSPDGKLLMYTRNGPPPLGDLWILSLTGDRPSTGSGRRTRFSRRRSTRERAGSRRTADGSPTRRTNPDGWKCTWRRDGKELYFYSSDGRLMVAGVNGRENRFEVGAVASLFAIRPGGSRSFYAPAPDGQRFLVNGSVLAQTTSSAPH